MMTFPATVEEFMEQYKIVDDEKVYTNGAELIPIFRMMQWFEHVSATDTISRQAAIDALNEVVKDHSITDFDAIASILDLPPAQPEPCEEILYRHYKGGTYELVCNNVTHTETGESLVVYRDCRGQLWARPESMFYGFVNVGDDLVPRFVLCRSEGDAE